MLKATPHTPRILVLDSGIGGLSVVKEIRNLLPFVYIRYFADLEAFPYGTKSQGEVVARVTSIVSQQLRIEAFDVVVLACNTASTAALEELRSQHDVPFVGVVPAIKPAAQLSQKKRITVLATDATISREYTRRLIEEFAKDCHVNLHASPKLVQFAEQKLMGGVSLEAIENEVSLIFKDESSSPDTVVLACTHFPILKPELERVKPHVQWVDSGYAIAKRVKFWIEKLDLIHLEDLHQKNLFVHSKTPAYSYSHEAVKEYLGEFEHYEL